MANDHSTYPLLTSINAPSDLRKLPHADLPKVVKELREFVIETLNECGGHFGANLGVIELTVALHYVFNTPNDKLIWDVGHQSYPHKVLTGRRDQLSTIRKPNGLSPFPKQSESIYDPFGTGHSSTSISAALGMCIAAKEKGIDEKAVAIIGDGGLTGGMAFEALNHAGSIDANLLVILNDNDMSISPNVGALTNYLARILSGKTYSQLRKHSKKVLSRIPPIKDFAKRTETHVKGMITPGTLFEELGIRYFGPIDGHNINTLIKTLSNLRDQNSPRLLHVVTTKGKGYPAAEAEQVKYHAVKAGFKADKPITEPTSKLTYSEVFGKWLCHQAKEDKQLVAITPAMCEGSGMSQFRDDFPNQYIDVGIAEQHSVTLAAGLASAGKKPIVAIYSTFLQRSYDQLIHDVALQNLDVTFAIDRAGYVGGDGPTHHGQFDLSYLRCIPNMIVMAPADENECWQMLTTAYQCPAPVAVRYPRGQGHGVEINKEATVIPIGKANVLRQGNDTAILAFGSMVYPALDAGETLNATVVNMRFIKPLDEALIAEITNSHRLIVTVEENTTLGGAGSAINEVLAKLNILISTLNLGLPDKFLPHGVPNRMLAEVGLCSEGIVRSIKEKVFTVV